LPARALRGVKKNRMRDLYLRLLSRLLVHCYYHRARLLNPENRPATGPILYVGLHRNGAVDGCVYKSLLPEAVFMISVQLRRSPIGRMFFDGIEVVRDKDRGHDKGAENNVAIERCIELLRRGGAVFVMPEGTSDLGHRHLPFKTGAARIVETALRAGLRPTVVPVGIHYERAWAWQSNVEVVVGAALSLDPSPEASGPEAVNLLHRKISDALEALAVEAPDAETFARRERAAYVAILGTGRSFFAAMKGMEVGVPETEAATIDFQRTTAGRGLFLHQGVPLLPIRQPWAHALHAFLLTPLVATAGVLNLPPLLVAWLAGRRFADARNTIALWRLLAGFPAFLAWTAASFVIAAVTDHLLIWLAYATISWLGLRSVYRLKKLAVSLGNLARARDLRAPLLALHRRLDSALTARGF